MQKRSSPLVPIIVAVLVAVMVGFNIIASNNRPKSQQEMQAEEMRRQEEAAKKTATGGGTGGTTPTEPSREPTAGNELALLDADTTRGNLNSSTTVTIGWRWTPDVQGDPSLVYSAVEEAEKLGRNVPVRIRIVNLDAVADGTVPEGVSVGGKTLAPLGANGALQGNAIRQAMMTAMKDSGGAGGPQKNRPQMPPPPAPTKQ